MTERSITCTLQGTEVEVLMTADLLTGLEANFQQQEGKSFAELEEEIEILLVGARQGRLRWNRDVKRVKLYPDELVFELRLNFGSMEQALGLRLMFLEDPVMRKVTFIGRHLKRPDKDLSAQRQAQNYDFDQAYKRYEERNCDSSQRAT
jgi:hypothetical protein